MIWRWIQNRIWGNKNNHSENSVWVWYNIYKYVQPEIKEIKIPLFHAFASMARSCFLVALLMLFRCRRFHKLVTNYSYISFLQIDNKDKKEVNNNQKTKPGKQG